MRKRKKQDERPPMWVALIVDESSSMSSVTNATISGFNEYLKDRKEDAKDGEVRLWLTKFNNTVNSVFSNVAAEEVQPLNNRTYYPSGMTALLDAVGTTILKLDEEVRKSKQKPKLFVLVMTDGEENVSRTFNKTQIKKMIKDRESEGNWTFVYMGANQDSWQNSDTMGFSKGNTVNYDNSTVQRATKGASIGTRSVRYAVTMNSASVFNIDGELQDTAEDLADAVVCKTTGSITMSATPAPTKKKRTTKKSTA